MEEELSDSTFEIRTKLKTRPTPSKRKFTNYFIDLGMLVLSILLFFTGIIKFLNIWLDLKGLGYIAAFLTELHDWNGIILTIFVFIHLALHWKWIVTTTKNIFRSSKSRRKKLNYFIDIGMLISLIIVFITGILKFPGLFLIARYFYNVSETIVLLHDWVGIILVALAFFHVVLHWKWFIGMTRKILRRDSLKIIIEIGGIIAFLLVLIIPGQQTLFTGSHTGDEVYIQGKGIVEFDPEEIRTIRPEIFRDGHYSIFDILVDLDNRGEIDMDFSFDSELNTYVINSIDGLEYWRLIAYYDGGWEEINVFRMDHYPYKPKMYIKLYKTSRTKLQAIYDTFREEIQRLEGNNGAVIIPEVIIQVRGNSVTFKDVKVTSHNLRNDFFQDGVITAIDVIMSLGDQGLITYKLNWYTTIGTSIVKNYYVDGINSANAYGTCGFVYEAGDLDFKGFNGNHIHMPSDIRVINSPEYELWFWICL